MSQSVVIRSNYFSVESESHLQSIVIGKLEHLNIDSNSIHQIIRETENSVIVHFVDGFSSKNLRQKFFGGKSLYGLKLTRYKPVLLPPPLPSSPIPLAPIRKGVLLDGREVLCFWKRKFAFSNFFGASIIVDGKLFISSEQWYQWSKAKFFDDEFSASKIIAEPNPLKIKRLGMDRNIKNFNSKIWRNTCIEKMRKGLLAKFTQHKILGDMLLGTKKAMLVESSPYDPYWGSGWHMNEWNDEWHGNKANWEGENQLGTALMFIRDIL